MCDLPGQHVPFKLEWQHLTGLTLADPKFGRPGRIDLLLGVDVFADVMRHGQWTGAPGSPSAFETNFGWVLAGRTSTLASHVSIATCHLPMVTGDHLLQKFRVPKEPSSELPSLTSEKRSVVEHFKQLHPHADDGRFVVPLPKRPHSKLLGESQSQYVRRFLSLERSLCSRAFFDKFAVVVEDYFEQCHTEPVPVTDLEKPVNSVFYLPLHVVRKESSTTTKVRAVFDASAPSSTGVSLNFTLLVGPAVHSSLSDVLLRFRLYCIALTTDVSRMYQAVLLDEADKDLHRFVWRRDPSEPLYDYRTARITFGVASSSSYAANMVVKQNAADFAMKYLLAARAIDSFYTGDGLTGADSVKEAVTLQCQLQKLFGCAGFLLRKWNCNNPAVLEHVLAELRDSQSLCTIPNSGEYVKTLGIEWNTALDHFRLTIAELPPLMVQFSG